MAPRRKLGQILVDAGLIDEFQLRSALSDQKRWGRPIGMTLLKLGFLEEGELLSVLSRQLHVPIVDLRGKRIAPEALAAIQVQVAEKSRCIPLFRKEEAGREILYLGMEDPTDLEVLDDLAFRTGIEIRPVLVGPDQLSEAIERYYHRLEWEAEGDVREEVGMLEPGDTAPLVYHPSQQEPAELGPEMLEPSPDTATPEVVAPPSEPELEFVEPLPPQPPQPSADPEDGLLPQPGPDAAHADAPPFDSLLAYPAPEPLERRTPAVEPQPTLPPRPRDVQTRTILRAITQLLIERDVITREELVETIRHLESETDGC